MQITSDSPFISTDANSRLYSRCPITVSPPTAGSKTLSDNWSSRSSVNFEPRIKSASEQGSTGDCLAIRILVAYVKVEKNVISNL